MIDLAMVEERIRDLEEAEPDKYANTVVWHLAFIARQLISELRSKDQGAVDAFDAIRAHVEHIQSLHAGRRASVANREEK